MIVPPALRARSIAALGSILPAQQLRNTLSETANHPDTPQDHLSVVLGFVGMLSSGAKSDEVTRLAKEYGWLDDSGGLTSAGSQLARALIEQSGTRTVFRV